MSEETELELESNAAMERDLQEGAAAEAAYAAEQEAQNEGDYLVGDTDKNVLKNLASMGAHLKELKVKMLQAEALFDAAKQEYEYYSNSVLPMEMYNAGVSRLDLLDGGTMIYERKYFCTPNKNEADKKKMADWLKVQGGEHLIKERAAVDASKFEALKAAGIPFTEICDFNTNSLKAFLKDKLGASATGGVAQIQISDIPECMHFQEAGTVSIDI
jgi:hypothetical protein